MCYLGLSAQCQDGVAYRRITHGTGWVRWQWYYHLGDGEGLVTRQCFSNLVLRQRVAVEIQADSRQGVCRIVLFEQVVRAYVVHMLA